MISMTFSMVAAFATDEPPNLSTLISSKILCFSGPRNLCPFRYFAFVVKAAALSIRGSRRMFRESPRPIRILPDARFQERYHTRQLHVPNIRKAPYIQRRHAGREHSRTFRRPDA